MKRSLDVSVVIPARAGGRLLEEVVRSVWEQQAVSPREVLLVDSGSPEEEVVRLAALGARIEPIAPQRFDHGLTRDFGARLSSGDVLVFLNQDALPVDSGWLGRLVAPFHSDQALAAVQGGIREFPREDLRRAGRRRFFWESCGPRFYFTSESSQWIDRHYGIGFSTVNCAIARWAWETEPFGPAVILEDKSWQARAHGRGWRIQSVPQAAVWHTHDYDLRALVRRCVSEGFGWRGVGEHYSLRTALRDMQKMSVWREWQRGMRSREMRRAAEVLFPLVRPLALWWGNRWATRIHA